MGSFNRDKIHVIPSLCVTPEKELSTVSTLHTYCSDAQENSVVFYLAEESSFFEADSQFEASSSQELILHDALSLYSTPTTSPVKNQNCFVGVGLEQIPVLDDPLMMPKSPEKLLPTVNEESKERAKFTCSSATLQMSDSEDERKELMDNISTVRELSCPSTFDIEIPWEEWKSQILMVRVAGKKVGRMLPSWANLVRRFFKEVNVYCVLNFKRHTLSLQPKRDGAYFVANGRCKHQNCCRYYFRSKNVPDVNNALKIHVRSEGKFCHEKGVHYSNQIRADEREKVRKELKHRLTANYLNEKNSSANMDAVHHGNHSTMLNQNVTRQIRHEVLKTDDLATEPITDLLKRLEVEKTLPESEQWIRRLLFQPSFQLIYFSDQQIETMKLTKEKTGNLIAHLDATGNIVTKLPGYCGDGVVYMYALVITNPLKGSPPLPVMEFIINNHEVASIAEPLKFFDAKAREVLHVKANTTIFTRFETDFSKALIGAVINTFFNMEVTSFLNSTWEILFKRRDSFQLNYHICRVHVIKTIMKTAEEHYGKKSTCLPVIKSCVYRYLLANSLEVVVHEIKNLLILCGNPLLIKEVEAALSNCSSNRFTTFPKGNSEWENFDALASTSTTIYKGSAFGFMFQHIYKECIMLEPNENKELLLENPYFKPEFNQYLLRHILPYTPLITHVMFPTTHDLGREDHNNASELWNRIVKHNLLEKLGKSKISRYVYKSKKWLKGSVNEFVRDLNLYESRKRKGMTQPKPKRLENSPVSIFVNKQKQPSLLSRKSKMLKNVSHNSKTQQVSTKVKETSKEEKKELSPNSSINPIKPESIPVPYTEDDIKKAKEIWKRGGVQASTGGGILEAFKILPFIPWGEHVKENSLYTFTNSCSIDNGLMALAAMVNVVPSVALSIQEEAKSSELASVVLNVVTLIQSRKDFNAAKALWMTEIYKKQELVLNRVNSLFGEEEVKFLKYFKPMIAKYMEIWKCPIHGILKQVKVSLCDFNQGKINNILKIINSMTSDPAMTCVYPECNEIPLRTIQPLAKNPCPFIVLQANAENDVKSVPDFIFIHQVQYQLFCASLFQSNPRHFVTVFPWGKNWVLYDGLNQEFKVHFPNYESVSLLWYVLR